jgi:hypothetical protein
VGRRVDDCLWPQPIWGLGTCAPYDPADVPHLLKRLCAQLHLPPLTKA